MKAELLFRKKEKKETAIARPPTSGFMDVRMVPQIDAKIQGTDPEVVLEIISVVRAAMAARKEWEEQ